MKPRLNSLLVILPLALMAVPSAAWAGNAEAGKVLFEANPCFTCHGLSGEGDGMMASVLNPKPRNFAVGDFAFDANGNGAAGEDEDLALVIKNGADKYTDASGRQGSLLMTPNPLLTDAMILDIIAHIRSLKVDDTTGEPAAE